MAKDIALDELRGLSQKMEGLYTELDAVIQRMLRFLCSHCPRVETWVEVVELNSEDTTTYLGFARHRPPGLGAEWQLLLWRRHEHMDEEPRPVAQVSTEGRVLALRHFKVLVEKLLSQARAQHDALVQAIETGEQQLREAEQRVAQGCPPPPGWKR